VHGLSHYKMNQTPIDMPFTNVWPSSSSWLTTIINLSQKMHHKKRMLLNIVLQNYAYGFTK